MKDEYIGPLLFLISVCIVIYYTVKRISINRECEKLRYQNINRRMKMEERQMERPSLHCTKVLECISINPEKSVRKYVAFKGCPGAAICPNFESLIGKFYRDVCEQLDSNNQGSSSSQEPHQSETSQCD